MFPKYVNAGGDLNFPVWNIDKRSDQMKSRTILSLSPSPSSSVILQLVDQYRRWEFYLRVGANYIEKRFHT